MADNCTVQHCITPCIQTGWPQVTDPQVTVCIKNKRLLISFYQCSAEKHSYCWSQKMLQQLDECNQQNGNHLCISSELALTHCLLDLQ
jgi:hypothetical protein